VSLFPKSRSRLRREASDWVTRLAGQPSDEDRAAFERWRDADRRHAEAYDRLAAIWNQAARLSPSRAAAVQTDSFSDRPGAFRLGLAASLAAAMVVASAVLIGARWLPSSSPEQTTMLFAARVGEIREVSLPDGSRITLDSGSRVEAAFSETERKLTLQDGRARFAVKHEARPFVVRARTIEVVATGTLFDVSLIGGGTAVVLLEGAVEVRAAEASDRDRRARQKLEPGEKLVLSPSAPPSRQPTAPGDTVWPTRMLEFDNTPLQEAAALANRYSRAQLRLGDARTGQLRVTGAFRAGDVAGLARSLAAAFDLRLVGQPDGSLLLIGPERNAPAPPR
jgi:transmembrane sensor